MNETSKLPNNLDSPCTLLEEGVLKIPVCVNEEIPKKLINLKIKMGVL